VLVLVLPVIYYTQL